VLTDDGLRRYGTDTEFFCTWKGFNSLTETDHLFILYVGKGSFITIPKRVCENAAQLEGLRTLLSSKIPEKA
jgi:hypothetical protein